MHEWVRDFVTVFLGSGASFAVVRIFLDIRREKLSRTDSANYLAMQIAFSLENYALECAKKITDHQIAKDSDGHGGSFMNTVPKPVPFPESDAYKYLDRELLNEILDFPQRCMMAQESAMFWWTVVRDNDCAQNAIGENSIKMGARALQLSRLVRTKNKLSTRSLTFDKWNIDEYYDRELTKVKEAEKRREEMEKQNEGL